MGHGRCASIHTTPHPVTSACNLFVTQTGVPGGTKQCVANSTSSLGSIDPSGVKLSAQATNSDPTMRGALHASPITTRCARPRHAATHCNCDVAAQRSPFGQGQHAPGETGVALISHGARRRGCGEGLGRLPWHTEAGADAKRAAYRAHASARVVLRIVRTRRHASARVGTRRHAGCGAAYWERGSHLTLGGRRRPRAGMPNMEC